jgi:hypothetical protein
MPTSFVARKYVRASVNLRHPNGRCVINRSRRRGYLGLSRIDADIAQCAIGLIAGGVQAHFERVGSNRLPSAIPRYGTLRHVQAHPRHDSVQLQECIDQQITSPGPYLGLLRICAGRSTVRDWPGRYGQGKLIWIDARSGMSPDKRFCEN